MLIRFWCDSDTILRGLHKKLVTVLYFSIINVFWLLNLCGGRVEMQALPLKPICRKLFSKMSLLFKLEV